MHSTPALHPTRPSVSPVRRAEASERSPLALAPLPMAPPALSPALGLRLELGGSSQWRAINRDGRVIGHVQPVHTPDGVRYRARRYRPVARRFLDLGEFWSAEDAAWCLHYAV